MSTAPENIVIVPVTLDAWVVTQRTVDGRERYKDLSLDYTDIHLYNGNELEKNDVFHAHTLTLNDRGVHLHWTLPAVLTHGVHVNGGLHFPPVPNRWLITRSNDDGGDLQEKSWIVESDFTGETGTNSWLIKDEAGDFKPTFIGRSYPAEATPATTASELSPPLSVMAPGNPLFAANYWSCRNVFGFHDGEIVADNPATCRYTIVGWYSDPANDRFRAGIATDNEVATRQREFTREHCRFFDDRLLPPQARSVFHASLSAIHWNTEANSDIVYNAHQARFTIARTTREALAAELAKALGAAERETLIAALLNGQLNDDPNAHELAARAHEDHFVPIDGGFYWEIVAENPEKKEGAPEKPFPDEGSFLSSAEYKRLLDVFAKLNQGQEQWDQGERRRLALRSSLRETLDTLNSLLAGREGLTSPAGTESLVARLLRIKEELGTLPSHEDDALRGFVSRPDNPAALRHVDLRQEVIGMLGRIRPEEQGRYSLKKRRLPVFYKPAEPVVMIGLPKDPGLPEQDHDHKVLLCRQPEHLTRSSKKTFEDVKAIPAGLVDTIRSIFTEATQNVSDDKSINPGKERQEWLKFLKSNVKKGSELLAIRAYRLDWKPVALLWGVDWKSDADAGPDNKSRFSNRGWAPEAGAWLLRHDHTDERQAPVSRLVEGYSLLARVALPSEKSLRDKTLETLGNSTAYFAQSLGGLFDALVLRRRAINVPIDRSPANRLPEAGFSERDFGASETYTLPILPPEGESPDPFLPLVSARASFTNLWVTDRFGRLISLVERGVRQGAEPTKSRLLSGQGDDDDSFSIPPALVQASRLRFEWRSAADKYTRTTSDPATSPVFGWMIMNLLDNGLVVFAPDGKLLGELNYREWPSTGFVWREDGKTSVATTGIAPWLPGLEKHDKLAALLRYIVNRPEGWDEFAGQVSVTHDSVAMAGASGDPGLADLFGIPLVLCRASLALERFGPAIEPPQVHENAPENSDYLAGTMSPFPVVLGSAEKKKDGLIGFFSGDDDQTFYSPTGDDGLFFGPSGIPLAMENEAGARDLSLLFYPGAGIHAAPGILPASYLELPDQVVSDALKTLRYSFLAGPLITRADNPSIPIPEEPGARCTLELVNWTGTTSKEIPLMPATAGKTDHGFEAQQVLEGLIKFEYSRKGERS